jgi:hypothetical protein
VSGLEGYEWDENQRISFEGEAIEGTDHHDAGKLSPSAHECVSLSGYHSAFFGLFPTLSFALVVMVDTRSKTLLEYPCIASQLTRSAALFE